MLRGEIRPVRLDVGGTQTAGDSHAGGTESGQCRLAVVVSNDSANAAAELLGRGVVTVVPLSCDPGDVFPFQVALPGGSTGLSDDAKALAEQVRSVSTDRIGATVGRLSGAQLAAVDAALRVHLGL
jgi:mRNA interferase MazF